MQTCGANLCGGCNCGKCHPGGKKEQDTKRGEKISFNR